MKVKIKKVHENAVIPSYAHEGDAGMDLTAVEIIEHYENIEDSYDNTTQQVLNKIEFNTGIAVEIPEGYVGLIFPRSSIHKAGYSLCNSIGCVDSNFRGSIKAFYYDVAIGSGYKVGDRIAQLIIMPYPKIEFEEVTELSDSVRGEGGFGSTGQ